MRRARERIPLPDRDGPGVGPASVEARYLDGGFSGPTPEVPPRRADARTHPRPLPFREGSRCALALLGGLLGAASATSAEIAAAPPRDLAVTIYRAPYRGTGGIDVGDPGGFALVTETRAVTIPAGESRLRFEGVADGIEPASAIVTGLPSGVIEKNRDARLLSPSALVAAARGRRVELVRTRPGGGGAVRVPGTILSDADGGVVFRTAQGVEALRCSGLPETFAFDPATTGLSATPTLSVLTRSEGPIAATVTLSYLADGFDWAADYVATIGPDGRTIDLGAWVTLANGNGVGFPDSRAQVVAGRLNHGTGEVEPIDRGTSIVGECWPRGSTSDAPDDAGTAPMMMMMMMMMRARGAGAPPPPPPPPAPMAGDVIVTAKRVELEQLGDLKLYRVPERTSIASLQSKQVRLLDRHDIPVDRIYGAELEAGADVAMAPAHLLLRTRNDAAHRLGLPLPSGKVAVFEGGSRRLLTGEAPIRDIAVDEEVELKLGDSPDVQVRQVGETMVGKRHEARVEISNARPTQIAFELRLTLDEGARVVGADRTVATKNGRPIFRLTIPADDRVIIRYQTKDAG